MLRSAVTKIFASALVFGAVAFSVPTQAQAQTANTCKCNKGCHSNAGQCLQNSQCKVGYAAVCSNRPGSQGGCGGSPISCDGGCACTPIEGYCDTIGGADYCDAGPQDTGTPDTYVPPPDTFVPDTFVPDTFVPDTFVPDTYVPPQDTYRDDTNYDTYVEPPDTYVPDTYVPDTYVEPPDTYVEPPDTYVEPPDTYVPPQDTNVDSCVPYVCPAPQKGIWVPHECDPFCSNPAGPGEFGCAGFFGTIKVTIDGANYCVPKCLAPANTTGALTCKDCERCAIGTGECLPDQDYCGDAGSMADSAASFDAKVPPGFPDGSVVQPDGSILLPDGNVVQPDGAPVVTPDSTVTDSSGGEDTSGTPTDGAINADGGVADTDFVDPNANGEAGTTDEGGCGCSVPGQSNDSTTLLGAGALAALGLVVARRRRRDAA